MAVLKFLQWFIEKLGVKSLLAIFLVSLAVGSVGYGMVDTIQGLDIALLIRTVLIGVLLSWLLARTKIWGWLAALIFVVFGILFVVFDVGDLFRPFVSLCRTAYVVGWEALDAVPEDEIDLTDLELVYSEVYYSVDDLLAPLGAWPRAVLDGYDYYDENAIQIVWGVVLWTLAVWTGWIVRRNNRALVGVLPSGIILATSLSYTGGRIIPLLMLLFSSLLLFGLTSFNQEDRRWKFLKIDSPEDLPKELGMTVFGMVVALVLIAGILPSISIPEIVNFVYRFTRPQIEESESVFESFGLDQQSSQGAARALWAGMPRYHTFRSSPEFLERVVMSVEISGGTLQRSDSDLPLPWYWRSLTYDQYSGTGWLSSDVDTRTYQAGQETIQVDSAHDSILQQDVRLTSGSTNYLYAAGTVLSADDKFKVSWRNLPEGGSSTGSDRDFFGGTIVGASYRVQSVIPNVTESDLRNASSEYPAWIQARYLQLPGMISDRVVALATEITAEDQNPYDKARSLETYLHGFTYTLDLEDLPEDREIADYFLFDLQEGYCDYYATSMVVMARAVGIPARLAIGYSRGEYNATNNRYLVIQADAHSWPEIYFSGIGWIPFEPTAGRVGAEMPAQGLGNADASNEIQPLDELGSQSWGIQWEWQTVLIVMLGAGCVILVSMPAVDAWRIKRMQPFDAVETLYSRLYSHGRSLNVPSFKGQTPLEFAAQLQDRVSALAQGSFWNKLVGQAGVEIQEFTHAYVLMWYSPLSITIDDREEIYAYWRYLRRRLWAARFRQWVSRKY